MKFVFTILFLIVCFNSIYSQEIKDYPVAIKRPHSIILHKDTIKQPYFWMKEKNTPEVVNYLEEENFRRNAFDDKRR